ncbi:hypothetical protein [Actinoplanes sp. NPDC089786]|uniref:HdeD family acid-resistance protein n=1 Tax=Actinoplanes sp. NPDC089786 TaxID=3155185 RepID=UPI003415E4D3
MFTTGPLSAVRHAMWGWLMLAGVAWLAVGWTVLRLEPADIVRVAGPVVLFGALTEALRACAGARTWWMNASMCLLFTATGVVLLTGQTSSYTTPAALIGWYLMVRGAVDVAVAMMTRDTDRVWGLIMVVGVLEAGLGFFSASPLSRTADLVVTVIGALGLLRGVADLVTGLRLREVRAARADILDLPPERAEGLSGYTAGLADFDTAPPKPPVAVRPAPRHRAAPRSSADAASAGAVSAGGADVSPGADPMWPGGPTEHALGASGGAPSAAAEPGLAAAGGMAAAGYVAAGGETTEQAGPMIVPGPPGAAMAYASEPAPHTAATDQPATTDQPAASAAPAAPQGDDFHQEVLRTTADLDAMLALAGVTGAAVGHHFDDEDMPEVPDTPEGVNSPAESSRKTHQSG